MIKISVAVEKVKALIKKVKTVIQTRIILGIGKMRMNLGIKGATAVHRLMAKNYLDKNNKEVRNYIVLLELPVKRNNKIYKMERLHWVNRNNFRRLKRKGWMPRNLQLNDLRERAFYTSDVRRSYQQEFAVRERAVERYLKYLEDTASASTPNP